MTMVLVTWLRQRTMSSAITWSALVSRPGIKVPAFRTRAYSYRFFTSGVPDQVGGLFWSLLSRIFIRAIQAPDLLVDNLLMLPMCLECFISQSLFRWCRSPSESHIPTKRLQRFYVTYLPNFSPLQGVGVLGLIQCWVPAIILGKYVEPLEQFAGWFGFVVGCLNALLVSQNGSLGFDLSLKLPSSSINLQGIFEGASMKEKRRIFSWENVARV